MTIPKWAGCVAISGGGCCSQLITMNAERAASIRGMRPAVIAFIQSGSNFPGQPRCLRLARNSQPSAAEVGQFTKG